MNKMELIELIAVKAELTKASATKALEVLLSAITSALQENDPVVVTGFGSFIVKSRAARVGYNPATGKKISIKATKVIGFKAGKALKEAIKNKESELVS